MKRDPFKENVSDKQTSVELPQRLWSIQGSHSLSLKSSPLKLEVIHELRYMQKYWNFRFKKIQANCFQVGDLSSTSTLTTTVILNPKRFPKQDISITARHDFIFHTHKFMLLLDGFKPLSSMASCIWTSTFFIWFSNCGRNTN